MRKIIGFLMAVVMAVGITACSEPVKEIEIVKNSEVIKPVELAVPMELNGYSDVVLVSFDGRYAVFSVNRTGNFLSNHNIRETAKIVVYDVETQKTVHLVNLNIPRGIVYAAAKQGDNLYFAVSFDNRRSAKVYINNGLETTELIYYQEDGNYKDLNFALSDENVILDVFIYNFEVTAHEFFILDGENVKHGYSHGSAYESFILENLECTDGENGVEYSFTEVINNKDSNTIIANRWKGNECRTIIELPAENAKCFGLMENMVFHNVQNSENTANTFMLAVTDIENGKTTEIDMMKISGFITGSENFGVFLHGEDYENITLVNVQDKVATFTDVDMEFNHGLDTNYRLAENSMFIWKKGNNDMPAKIYLIKQ
ncbi:MAG: hypothetical protein IJN77_02065 [Oscillospiraceae bacterium]|nr:hypothetical protein [Oscillospiraceae bacterium]